MLRSRQCGTTIQKHVWETQWVLLLSVCGRFTNHGMGRGRHIGGQESRGVKRRNSGLKEEAPEERRLYSRRDSEIAVGVTLNLAEH